MDGQLGAQGASDDALLQLLEHGPDPSGAHRACNQLLKQFVGQDRSGAATGGVFLRGIRDPESRQGRALTQES